MCLLPLGAGCGTAPDTAFLEVGGEYAFTAAILRRYDCAPALTAPRNDAVCGAETGAITVGVDTVAADIGIDTYLPGAVCDADGCRDNPTRGRFTGTASVRVVQCEGTDGTGCDVEPAALYEVAVTHATISCTGDHLSVIWTGYAGRSVVSVGVEIPGAFQAGFGVAEGREIRGVIASDVLGSRDLVEGAWVLR